jgi:hypothetical protein
MPIVSGAAGCSPFAFLAASVWSFRCTAFPPASAPPDLYQHAGQHRSCTTFLFFTSNLERIRNPTAVERNLDKLPLRIRLGLGLRIQRVGLVKQMFAVWVPAPLPAVCSPAGRRGEAAC